MAQIEELLKQLVDIVERPEKAELKPVLLETIETALKEEIERTRQEKEFHKRLNEDMLQGLQTIYKEIAQVAVASGPQGAEAPKSETDATAIFHEASKQLDEIMTTTLEAADNIMDKAETIQRNQNVVEGLLDTLIAVAATPSEAVGLRKLHELLLTNREAVSAIVLALSFQDLTGQRIKKVVHALGSIHQTVVQTYVSAGLMLKKSEEEPEKDLNAIAEESKKKADAVVSSELRGPTLDASQKDVDDLLAQLGF